MRAAVTGSRSAWPVSACDNLKKAGSAGVAEEAIVCCVPDELRHAANSMLIAMPATNARRESAVGTASSVDSDKSFTDFSCAWSA
jgi:hypothetical protein